MTKKQIRRFVQKVSKGWAQVKIYNDPSDKDDAYVVWDNPRTVCINYCHFKKDSESKQKRGLLHEVGHTKTLIPLLPDDIKNKERMKYLSFRRETGIDEFTAQMWAIERATELGWHDLALWLKKTLSWWTTLLEEKYRIHHLGGEIAKKRKIISGV